MFILKNLVMLKKQKQRKKGRGIFMNKENIKTIAHPAFVLFIIVFVSVALLVFFDGITREKIELINAQNSEKARIEVLPEAKGFEKIEFEEKDIVKEIYEGHSDNEIAGYCVSVVPKGYGGDITMTVGIDKDLKVTGVKITNSSETAGLGKNAEKEDFTNQYIGLEKGINVVKGTANKEKNEIDALSGATITSKAVSKGVDRAIEEVEKILKEGAAK